MSSTSVEYRGKRLLDILLAAILALPASLISIACAVVIWLECRTNPFFLQVRVGRDERPFRLVKLRTMVPETADLPSHETDRRGMLRSGRVFRRLKWDELPQILNVLRGEMSFVGPRPCLPSQFTLIEERRRRGVYHARPGITGLAQIAGIDMSAPEALAVADAAYLQAPSLTEDLRILMRTLVGAGRGDAVLS